MAISFSVELVEAFINAAWALPLSARERICLMTSLPLVNSAWRDLYMRVSSRDIYIPCASYCHHLLTIMQQDDLEDSASDEEAAALTGAMCRSITFLIEQTAMPPRGHDLQQRHSSADVMPKFFDSVSPGRLPRLREVCIHYLNANFDDFFENWQCTEFPPQVDFFEIKHAFSRNVPAFLISAMRDKHHAPLGLPVRLPNVKHLSLVDVGSDYIADMTVICPNIEVLELKLAPKTDIFICLPSSVENVVLHAPDGVDLSMYTLPAPNTFPIPFPRTLGRSRWLSLKPYTLYRVLYAGVTLANGYTLVLMYPSHPD